MSKSVPTNFTLLGIIDFHNQDPWANAPVSYQDWKAGATETPDQLAYWRGFNQELAH